MLNLVPSPERLTEIFHQCTAPTFFLFATAAIVGLMNTRLSELNKNLRELNNTDDLSEYLIQNFTSRIRLLRRGIFDALVGSVFTILLLIDLFVLTFFSIDRAYGAAVLFTIATIMLGMGLIRFA